MVLAPLPAGFQSLPPLPTMKLGPSGADSWVGELVHTLGPCGSLQPTLLWGWEFLLLPLQPPRMFSIRGLRLYFSVLVPWVAQSALFPRCFSWFIYEQMWGHRVWQPLPCGSASCSPSCPVPQSTTSLGPPATALLRVLSTPAARLHPSYRYGWMFLLYLLGCQTSIQFDFLSVLDVFCF